MFQQDLRWFSDVSDFWFFVTSVHRPCDLLSAPVCKCDWTCDSEMASIPKQRIRQTKIGSYFRFQAEGDSAVSKEVCCRAMPKRLLG